MKLRYTIEDLHCMDFVVDFEFHRELDGMFVFDGGWDIVEILTEDGEWLATSHVVNPDQIIHRWLSAGGGEDKIYSAAEREFK